MLDTQSIFLAPDISAPASFTPSAERRYYLWWKWSFDRLFCVVLILPLATIAVILYAVNPLFNKGPVFFIQDRMGAQCRRFTAFKFRTMSPLAIEARGAFDAVETERITRLGSWLRKTRIDELPQILNVLLGEMSLIGPRPDAYDHACIYLHQVPGYHLRCQAIPGISGFAQTEVGYVAAFDDVQRKVNADLHYLENSCIKLDLWIIWRTLVVVLFQRGT